MDDVSNYAIALFVRQKVVLACEAVRTDCLSRTSAMSGTVSSAANATAEVPR
jgi:hypothetical protein